MLVGALARENKCTDCSSSPGCFSTEPIVVIQKIHLFDRTGTARPRAWPGRAGPAAAWYLVYLGYLGYILDIFGYLGYIWIHLNICSVFVWYIVWYLFWYIFWYTIAIILL